MILLRSKMTASLTNLQNELEKELLLALVNVHIDINKKRKTEISTKLQNWIRSTPQKDIFAFCLLQAALYGTPYRISEIVEKTHLTRQSVSQMTKDWVAEGWAKAFNENGELLRPNSKPKNGRSRYMASDEVIKLGMAFSERFFSLSSKHLLLNKYSKAHGLKESIKEFKSREYLNRVG